MNLTRAQQDAVQRTGQDVCVIAGPGSGKTRVLIERFAISYLTAGRDLASPAIAEQPAGRAVIALSPGREGPESCTAFVSRRVEPV